MKASIGLLKSVSGCLLHTFNKNFNSYTKQESFRLVQIEGICS